MVLANIWANLSHSYEWEVQRGTHGEILYTPKGGGVTHASNVFHERGLSLDYKKPDTDGTLLVDIPFPNLPIIGDRADVSVPLGKRWTLEDLGKKGFLRIAGGGYLHRILELGKVELDETMERAYLDLEDRLKALELPTNRAQMRIRFYFTDSNERGD